MAAKKILDKDTVAAIKAEAKKNGISAAEVDKVLAALPREKSSKTVERGAQSTEQELLTLLSDDEDKVSGDVERATGVKRGNARTILLLAAPFLIKYLLSGNNSGNNSSSLLGSLLGGGQQAQPSGASALLGLLGGQQAQPQNSSAALLNLLGGQQTQPQQSQSLLGSLLGGQQSQPVQQSQSILGSLLGGGQQAQPQQASSGGIMDMLFNILGDN